MISFIAGTLIFFVAAFFLTQFLDDKGLENDSKRKVMIGILATIISIIFGNIFDKII